MIFLHAPIRFAAVEFPDAAMRRQMLTPVLLSVAMAVKENKTFVFLITLHISFLTFLTVQCILRKLLKAS